MQKVNLKNLTSIFSDYAKKLPPAGAGECAAPKLLQYAYINNLKPVAMAEFWLGDSPKTEIRHSGFFYPACKHKCEPILDFMLSGLDVEPNPLTEKDNRNLDHFIIFEDDQILVVNKPSGMASVPGKNGKTSLYEKLEKNHSESRHLFVVHRLDMDTSGIIVFAKTKSAHKELQIQFRDHSIKKRYVAVVEGDVKDDEGEINLPICLNPDERPFQMVDYTFGKRAVTKYKVLCRNYKIKGSDNKEMPSKSVKESNSETLTKVLFSPLTGRTHQLRVHSSHHHGLDLPIKGDSLYGKKDKRLYLHAEYIEFTHPSTGKRVSFNVEPDF
jgi:Pseudouridylate synthases, 23S RNA-specific